MQPARSEQVDSVTNSEKSRDLTVGRITFAPTPGPWQIDPGTAGAVEARAFDGSWKYIVDRTRGGSPVEAESNARLIAAAPNLLAVAHAAFHALKSYEFGNASPDLARECAAELEAVIAKAEGR